MRGRQLRGTGVPYVILQGSPGDGMANTIDNDIGGVIAARWRRRSWPSQRRKRESVVPDGNEQESDAEDDGDDDATTNYYSTRTASDGAESSKDGNENVVEEDITTTTNYYSTTTAINSIICQWQDECTLIEREQMKEFTCDVRSLLKQRRKQQQHRRHHQQHHCSITNNDDNSNDCNNSTNGQEKNYRQQTTNENGAPHPPCNGSNGSCCNISSQTKKTTPCECRDYDDDFEVAQNHYIWYQKHGRLIVFDTLPSPSSSSSSSSSSSQQQVDDDSVITTLLSPGTIVMVNKIYILDSRTMQVLLVRNVVANEEEEEEKDAGTNYNVNDDHNDKCIQQGGHSCRRRHYCHTNNNNSQPITTTIIPTITMLEITSPRNGYIIGSIHSYPLVLRGLPELYTNINSSEVVDNNDNDCKEDKVLVVGAATSQQQPATATTTATQRKWLWRITNYPDGAYVRTGPELSTRHIATLNYGAVCNLTCKIVNNMGLNRLRIEFTTSTDTTTTTDTAITTAPTTTIYSALENDFDINTNEKSDSNNNNTTKALPTSSRVKGVVSGYISQYLNPLSGQRGCIAYPISFPRPALYEIIYPDEGGLAVHSDIELSSRINTYIPRGAIVCITGRGYTNHPRSECVERLRLAGGAGWISSTIVIPESVTGPSLSSFSCTNNNDDKNNKKIARNTSLQCDNDNNNMSTVSFTVRMVGIDPTFDPDNPGRFHFHATRMVMEGLLYPPLTTADTNEINRYCSKHNEHIQSEMTGTRSNTGSTFSQTQSNELHKKDQLSSIGNMESVDLASSVLLDMSLTDYTRQQQHHVTASEDSIVLTSSQHTIPPRCNTLNSTIQESTSFVYGHNNRRSIFDSNNRCLICLSDERTSTIVHGETGHIACCLACARILKARGDNCPVCRLPIDLVIQHFTV